MTGLALSTGASPLWYATRATGIVTLALLTMSVLLGIAGSLRAAAPGLPRLVTARLHRNVSLLAVCLLGVHVGTAVADSYVHLGLLSVVVPFSAPYRRPWTGLGTIALDIMLALAATSLARRRLSYRAWRTVHWLAYASWPLALWHGLGTGTDRGSPWLLALDAACAAAVAAAAGWRAWLALPGSARQAALAERGRTLAARGRALAAGGRR